MATLFFGAAAGAIWIRADHFRLLKDGDTVPAVVTFKGREDIHDESGAAALRYFQYDFKAGVITYSGKSHVGKGAYERYSQGDRIEITYLPNRPDVSLYGGPMSVAAELGWFLLLTAVMAFLGLTGLFYGFSRIEDGELDS